MTISDSAAAKETFHKLASQTLFWFLTDLSALPHYLFTINNTISNTLLYKPFYNSWFIRKWYTLRSLIFTVIQCCISLTCISTWCSLFSGQIYRALCRFLMTKYISQNTLLTTKRLQICIIKNMTINQHITPSNRNIYRKNIKMFKLLK